MKKILIITTIITLITGCSSVYKKSTNTAKDLVSAFAETPKTLIVTFLDIIKATMIYHDKNKRWPKDKKELYAFSAKENIPIDRKKFKYLLFVPQNKKRLNIRFIAVPKLKVKAPIYLTEFSGIIGIYTPHPALSIKSNNYIEIYYTKIVYSIKDNTVLETNNPFTIYIRNYDTYENLKVRGTDASESKGKFYME